MDHTAQAPLYVRLKKKQKQNKIKTQKNPQTNKLFTQQIGGLSPSGRNLGLSPVEVASVKFLTWTGWQLHNFCNTRLSFTCIFSNLNL